MSKIRIVLDPEHGMDTRYPSGIVIDADGHVIGDAHSYTYGGTAFAVHTRDFAGYVPMGDVEFVSPLSRDWSAR